MPQSKPQRSFSALPWFDMSVMRSGPPVEAPGDFVASRSFSRSSIRGVKAALTFLLVIFLLAFLYVLMIWSKLSRMSSGEVPLILALLLALTAAFWMCLQAASLVWAE